MAKAGKVRIRHRPRVKAAVQVSGPMKCLAHNKEGCPCGFHEAVRILKSPITPMDNQLRTGYVPEGRPDRRKEH